MIDVVLASSNLNQQPHLATCDATHSANDNDYMAQLKSSVNVDRVIEISRSSTNDLLSISLTDAIHMCKICRQCGSHSTQRCCCHTQRNIRIYFIYVHIYLRVFVCVVAPFSKPISILCYASESAFHNVHARASSQRIIDNFLWLGTRAKNTHSVTHVALIHRVFVCILEVEVELSIRITHIEQTTYLNVSTRL